MNKITSKSRLFRLCLMSYILLCSLLTSENALSVPSWTWRFMQVGYDKKDKSITIVFVFNAYYQSLNKYGFLKSCDFEYSTNFINYTHLMGAEITHHKKGTGWASISMRDKKAGESIQFRSSNPLENGKKWPENHRAEINAEATNINFKFEEKMFIYNCCYLSIKWNLTKAQKRINCIKITGVWISENAGIDQIINDFYPVDIIKCNSTNRLDNFSVLDSEINNKVIVTKDADAINVSGVEPGENIKVYTISGIEVKSVVVTDQVLNIMLPKDQIYIVTAGQGRYKVAL